MSFQFTKINVPKRKFPLTLIIIIKKKTIPQLYRHTFFWTFQYKNLDAHYSQLFETTTKKKQRRRDKTLHNCFYFFSCNFCVFNKKIRSPQIAQTFEKKKQKHIFFFTGHSQAGCETNKEKTKMNSFCLFGKDKFLFFFSKTKKKLFLFTQSMEATKKLPKILIAQFCCQTTKKSLDNCHLFF